MTKRDLFKIIFKLFGVYLIIGIIDIAMTTVVYSFYDIDLAAIALNILILAMLSGLIYIVLFKSDLIINALKLDKGFDNDMSNLKISSETSIVKAGLVIICIYFMIDSIPDIIQNVFYAFKNSFASSNLDKLDVSIWRSKANYGVLSSAIIKFVLSLIVLANKDKIVSKIDKLN